MKKLPTYKDWTIDIRLKEFRKIDDKTGLEFVHFDSEEGKAIFKEYCQSRHDELCEQANDYLQAVLYIEDDDFDDEQMEDLAKEMGGENNV